MESSGAFWTWTDLPHRYSLFLRSSAFCLGAVSCLPGLLQGLALIHVCPIGRVQCDDSEDLQCNVGLPAWLAARHH